MFLCFFSWKLEEGSWRFCYAKNLLDCVFNVLAVRWLCVFINNIKKQRNCNTDAFLLNFG